jgi:hypothetical protein
MQSCFIVKQVARMSTEQGCSRDKAINASANGAL